MDPEDPRIDDDVSPTPEEWARAEPGADFFARRGLVPPKPRGRPKAARTKVAISLRVDPDTLDKFKATGDGWQARMNEALDRAAIDLEKQE
ncbi:MAG: BrnA antitoxin family protein [Alphaproteobacteria bacterium]|nr:BrnA antitoxin family protein [Alphaproteobacteria bacterium]